MRLAVFTGQVFWWDDECYSTDEAFIKFVTGFQPHFERIVFCDSVAREPGRKPYVLDSRTTEVCPLPYFNLYSLWKNHLAVLPKVYRTLRKSIHQWDVVWLHAPHPVGIILAHICRSAGKPFFFFVRQDLKQYVQLRNKGLKKVFGVAAAAGIECIFRWLFRKVLTFTVGEQVFEHYSKNGSKVVPVAVSLITDKDIKETVRTRSQRNVNGIRLLNVGRLDPEKGIIYLLKAVERMAADGKDVTLHLIGTGTEREGLEREVIKRGLDRRVTFQGYIEHGPELLDHYRNSDIFVLPSLTEGCPQTLFEAMACGIPIVAAKVGGVPNLLKHNKSALLVSPRSPEQICDAVDRLIQDRKLGKDLAKNAFSVVRNHTMEAERHRMMIHIG